MIRTFCATLIAGLTLLWGSIAEAMVPYMPPPLEEFISPAGVSEYKAAERVLIVRPRSTPNPPCFIVQLLVILDIQLGSQPADYCGPRERSRRYALDVQEVLKGAPIRSLPAKLHGLYPLDPAFMEAKRPDLWEQAFRLDRSRAEKRHAGFSFLHAGWIRDRSLMTESGFDRPRQSDGRVEFPMLDPDLDYIIFVSSEFGIVHWEPILRGEADKDLLVQRLRTMKAGRPLKRPTVAPKDFFPRFMDAAIYEAGDCNPRLLNGQKISSIDRQVFDSFGWPITGPTPCAGPPRPPTSQSYLVLSPDVGNGMPDNPWYGGPNIRTLPIIDGKIRPSDLVTQVRIWPETPIPVDRVLAWVRTGRRADDGSDLFWYDIVERDPPLKLSRQAP